MWPSARRKIKNLETPTLQYNCRCIQGNSYLHLFRYIEASGRYYFFLNRRRNSHFKKMSNEKVAYAIPLEGYREGTAANRPNVGQQVRAQYNFQKFSHNI